MDDPNALFSSYESDYCNKSTGISQKINSAAALSGGASRGRQLTCPKHALKGKQWLHV